MSVLDNPLPSCCCTSGWIQGSRTHSSRLVQERALPVQQRSIYDDEDECLKERKWWCFLLSSIVTFLAGILLVLLGRLSKALFCRKGKNGSYTQTKQGPGSKQVPHGTHQSGHGNNQREEFEGTLMNEAKDWALGLISGQSTTGRILVRLILFYIT